MPNEYKVGLLDPRTNILRSIITDLGVFTFDTYPTAYLKVNIAGLFPEPKIGQMYDRSILEFVDIFSDEGPEDLPSLTRMKEASIKEIYLYAKNKIEEVGSVYSMYETNEWPRLLEEARKFQLDSSDIGPVLQAKKDRGGVTLNTYVDRVIDKSDDLHAFLGAVTVWRTGKVDAVMAMTRRVNLNNYDLRSGFPDI